MSGFSTAEADRRIANLVQVGVVASVNAGTARASVNIGDLSTALIPVAQLRAGAMSFWWMPAIGEQVLVVAPGGDMARAVIVASIFAGNAPSTNSAKPMIDLAGGTMVVNGDIEVTGDVIASGISLANHKHGGVGIGPADTGVPK